MLPAGGALRIPHWYTEDTYFLAPTSRFTYTPRRALTSEQLLEPEYTMKNSWQRRLLTLISILALALMAPIACGDDDDDNGGNGGSANNTEPNNTEPNNTEPNNTEPNNTEPGNGGDDLDLDVETDADGSQVFSDMSEEEFFGFCDDFETAWQNMDQSTINDGFCKVFGLFGAAFSEDPVQGCEDSYQECLSEPEDIFDGCTQEDYDDLADCDATVDEYIACFQEIADGLGYISGEFQCVDITDDDAMDDDDLQDAFDSLDGAGPACSHFDDQCPGFFEEEDSGEF